MDFRELIQLAFTRLSEQPGFVDRPDQVQLALLLGDCIEDGASGAFEAPTGLGKSLANLIPSIAHSIASGKRVAIATYTNVLAEQYWRQDVPLALSLFDSSIKTAFLIGRQRYVCLAQLTEEDPMLAADFDEKAKLGIETEFRNLVDLKSRELTPLWQKVSTPPVCPGRLCPFYQQCFYYKARREAEKAQLVITNHNVLLQDAMISATSESKLTLLGKLDYVIVDEAHDLIGSATNAFEFELSEFRLAIMQGLSVKIERSMRATAERARAVRALMELGEKFRKQIELAAQHLRAYQQGLPMAGILVVAPDELMDHPQVKQRLVTARLEIAEAVATEVSDTIFEFNKQAEAMLERWQAEELITEEEADSASDAIENYSVYLQSFAINCLLLFDRSRTGVTYSDFSEGGSRLRRDVIDLAPPLKEFLWDRLPVACVSATLALDESFEFFNKTTGFEPAFEEILPSPFDFSTQAAVYVPKAGAIPDPTEARKQGREEDYFLRVAQEVQQIIELMQGRTLVLFHSRREMMEVASRVVTDADLPILIQRGSATASVGERFRKNTRASLFALRSFWTGFDAPGETLSCVVVVRVPFQVPVDPPQVAKHVWLQSSGQDSFQHWSLPHAKMLVRQGVGRLIRRSSDVGLICLLDARLRTKGYGQSILENLPPGMREFDDAADAIGWLQLG